MTYLNVYIVMSLLCLIVLCAMYLDSIARCLQGYKAKFKEVYTVSIATIGCYC